MSDCALDMSVLQKERDRVEKAMSFISYSDNEKYFRLQKRVERFTKRIDELVEELLAS